MGWRNEEHLIGMHRHGALGGCFTRCRELWDKTGGGGRRAGDMRTSFCSETFFLAWRI